jgi:hypothetical protein
MLAVNITASLGGRLDDRPRDVAACAEGWWIISDTTLRDYADQVLAVADNIIVGVFDVLQWRRDPANDNKVVFRLGAAPQWQWLVGQDSPVTWGKGQANPVRKVGGVFVTQLRSRQPHHTDAGHGWTLDVAPDGLTATVRGPGALAVTAMQNGVVTMTATGQPTDA